MAKVHQVEVSVSRTHNLGNYESLKLEVRQSMVMGPDDSIEDVYRYAWDCANVQLDAEYISHMERLNGGKVSFQRIG